MGRKPTAKKTKKKDSFFEYISDKNILIADTSASMRTNIAKLLKTMGAQTHNIRIAMDLPSAIREIDQKRPHVIVTDYFLGSDCGLKLIEPHHGLALDEEEREASLFIVITANNEQSAIVEAAEGEVDAYVLKPFSVQTFKEHFLKAFQCRTQPSPYWSEIRRGKSALLRNKTVEALDAFQFATHFNELPSLAHYYIGLTHQRTGDHELAEAAFRKGLEIRPRHIRCSLGLMETLYHQDRFQEAYVLAKDVLTFYTLSPARLEMVIHLAVKNRAFDDIAALFEIFEGIEYRSRPLTLSMVAALVVAGKFEIQQNRASSAERFFDSAVSLSHRSTPVLRRIIMAWLDIKEFSRAERFLNLFPMEAHKEAAYEILHFLILNGTAPTTEVLNAGLKLLHCGIRSPEIYETLIKRMIESHRLRGAESLAFEAASTYEHHREKFMRLIPK